MLNTEIEFKENGNSIAVWWEQDTPPFKDKLIGAVRKGDDGYYRFHPARDAVMHCKILRVLAEKVSNLNIEGE